MAAPEEIRHALTRLFSAGDVVELRALGDGGVHSGYFSDFDILADRAGVLDAFHDVTGVYVTLNQVDPALLSRRANRMKHRLSRSDATTADADIIWRRWLPIDFDPVRPAGVSATDEEHVAALRRAEEVRAWLAKRGFPAPVVADSGNGAHLLYQIDLPNDGASLRLVKGCLAVLDAFFSDDTVHCDTANCNAARIWKLYGTTACKGDDTAERPHRQARILSAPDEVAVVPADVLRSLAGFIPSSARVAETGRRRGSFDLRWWLSFHGIAVSAEKPWQGGTLFVLADCPFSSAHTDGAFAIQFSNGAVFAGCHHDSCGGGAQRWHELRAMYESERAAGEMAGTACRKTDDGTPAGPEGTPGASGCAALSLLPDAAGVGQESRRRALEILERGDPLEYMLDVFHRDHVGDRTVAECLVMSVASQSVENTAGLHVSISGNSGKGKTHACNAMARLLPEEFRLTGTVSDKALFYCDDLRPGTVLLFDDVTLSDDMQEVLKSATANFREPIVHRTLTRDRQLRVCTIPERCVWWLAKVESIGDDQVMNRMLTVWIDDSQEQDRAVLSHLKVSEAGDSPAVDDDPDIFVCRAIWEVLKGAVRRVSIPFAQRIGFSAIQNRRNPVMLFDLIKCHALLHFLQRETDASGALIATTDDFRYACRLFHAINGDVGGQETKLTKNEAAALETISRLGVEVFTTHQLQDAIGLSYHQTRRLLQGYSNAKAVYAGILDKCPAISPVDATVAESLSGMDIRRHERYFSFDAGIYREWKARADVWLADDGVGDEMADGNDGGDGENGDGCVDDCQNDCGDDCGDDDGDDDDGSDACDGGGDDDDNNEDTTPPGSDREETVCTFAPPLHSKTGKSANEENDRNDVHFSIGDGSRDRCTEKSVSLHPHSPSYSNPKSREMGVVCVSEVSAGANSLGNNENCTPNGNWGGICPANVCTSGCNSDKTGANVQTRGESKEETKVETKEETREEIKTKSRGETKKNSKTNGRTLPLPGILDHQNFCRSPVCLGTCSLCGEKPAVYHSDVEQVSICEGCYARLVREWNRGEGVM